VDNRERNTLIIEANNREVLNAFGTLNNHRLDGSLGTTRTAGLKMQTLSSRTPNRMH
jgi:hypothetical protein